jgi:hypothetical protein
VRRAVAALVVLAALAAPATAAAGHRVLLTGDSMMEVLQRRLAPDLRALGHEVVVDARLGSGLTRPFVVDWVRHAPRQAERIQPAETIAWIGTGDIDDFRGVARCCGERWVATFARRVAGMARAYGSSWWLTIPAPAHPELARVHRAVNRALRRSGVRLIDLAAVFSPGGAFHRRLRWGGELRTVRASDGVHLSPWGSLIASAVITDALAASEAPAGP